MLVSTFLTEFQARRTPLIVDDEDWAFHLRAQGWQTIGLESFQFDAPSADGATPAVVVASRLSTTEQLRQLWGEATMPICHLSLAKFDPRPEVLDMLLASVLAWKVDETLANRQRQYQALFSSQSCLVQTQERPLLQASPSYALPSHAPVNPLPQRLSVQLHDEVEVASSGELLEPGHLYSLSEFGEAALVNLSGPNASFSLSGVFCFDDFSSLSNTELQRRFYPTLAELRTKARSGKNHLVLEENQLVRGVIGGEDCTEQLHALFAGCLDFPEWGLCVTELGIGCTQSLHPLDCRLNTPFNRGMPGFFVGVGRGARIPHLDFVAWNAECTFNPVR